MASEAPNKNKAWDMDEEELLMSMFVSQKTLVEMIQATGRSASGVVSRLAKLDMIYYSAREEAYFTKVAIWTFRDVRAADKAVYEIGEVNERT